MFDVGSVFINTKDELCIVMWVNKRVGIRILGYDTFYKVDKENMEKSIAKGKYKLCPGNLGKLLYV